MTEHSKTAPYGFWTGLFDIRALFEKPATPMYPAKHAGCTYWLEARAEEGGRIVMMQRRESADERCLTPEGYSIRSRVHEYGGCPYTIHGGSAWFVNDDDQRIYRQALDGGDPLPVTPAGRSGVRRRYIDLAVTADGGHLVCVMEEESPSGVENMLAAIPLGPGARQEPQVIQRGRDFYANPVLAPGGGRIAWFQWDHPCMPWDQCEVLVGSLQPDGGGLRIDDLETVVDADGTSACQLAFDRNGDLFLAIDGAGAPGPEPDYWNLYRWRRGEYLPLTNDRKEYGASHWVFGDRRYVVLDEYLLAVRTGPDGDELARVDKDGGGVEPVDTDAVDIRQMTRADTDEALMITAARDRSPTLTIWKHHRLTPVKPVRELLPSEAVSRPKAIRFTTGNGSFAHAYFYPPCNPNYRAPAGQSPPVLVMVHGGPTSRCSNALDLTRQYWTGIGFAVLDVNYRGSTGYGRAYRQSLLGEWGRRDTEDVIKAVEFAVEQGWVDGRRVFIRGRSAGGYAVLSALTGYPDVFAAGACYYGIGNLETLAQITHKFEGRYTDRLIGEDYRPDHASIPGSRFRERSPIHSVSAIRCPLIVFQGLEDKIVPPDVSREIARALEAQGVEHQYIEYPGEGHGFRSSDTNIDALERETEFYRKVLDESGQAAGRRRGSG